MYCWYVVTRLIGRFSPTAPQHHLNSYCVFCRLVNLYSTAIPGSRFETKIFLDLIVVASSIFYVHVFYGTVDDCRCSISLLGVLFSDGCLKDQIAPDIPSSPNYWEVMGLFFWGPAIPPRKEKIWLDDWCDSGAWVESHLTLDTWRSWKMFLLDFIIQPFNHQPTVEFCDISLKRTLASGNPRIP